VAGRNFALDMARHIADTVNARDGGSAEFHHKAAHRIRQRFLESIFKMVHRGGWPAGRGNAARLHHDPGGEVNERRLRRTGGLT
jgi:hypothetical protein